MAEKLKCARCGKWFKANKKQTLCAECLAKERAAKKSGPQLVSSTAGHSASVAPQRPEAVKAPSTITIVAATPPPELAVYGAQARIADRHTAPTAPERYAPTPQPQTPAPAPQPVAVPTPSKPATPPRPQPPKNATPQPEKQARQPRPATPPFELTEELRAAIETRYLELAQPVEFDGIRTQIAGELHVPKPAVKQVVRDLRVNRQLPSWWELKAYKGSDETLERIRVRYLPLLPVPPVGVHKQIADELQMDAPQVYQAIRRLRAEMKLPQYNAPELHANETPPPQDVGNGAADPATDATRD